MLAARADLPAGSLSIKVYPEFLLRSTGIPFDLLTQHYDTQAIRALERLYEAQQTLENEQTSFLNDAWQQALDRARERYPDQTPLLKPFYNVNRQVRRRAGISPESMQIWGEFGDPAWPNRWNELLLQVQQADESSVSTYEAALDKGRRALHATFQDPRLQEAVFLSNPGFFERVFSGWVEKPFQESPSQGTKQCETIVHRYLRRFASKCEATAFFGPTLFAKLDPTQAAPVQIGTPQPERIFVESNVTTLQELSRVLAEQLPLEERYYIRRNPLFREGSDQRMLCTLNGQTRALSPDALLLWRQINGSREPATIASELDFTSEQLTQSLQELKPFLLLKCEIPATEQKPLEYLARFDGENGPVHRLLEIRDRYIQTPWPQRSKVFSEAEEFCRSNGLEAEHGQGSHYADRTVFREDRSSPFNASLTIGQQPSTQIMETLKAVLPLCFVAALLVREDARESLRAVLRSRSVPLARLASVAIPDKGWRAKQLQTKLTEELKKKASGRNPIQVTQEELKHILMHFWEMIEADDLLACLPGPDLMAAGNDIQDATWILSELHDDASSIFGGNPANLHPDTTGLWANVQSEVARLVDPQQMATVISRRRSKHITPELPGTRIELSGRATDKDYETIPIADVTVHPEAKGVYVGDRLLHLYPGDLSSILHRGLALPCVTPFPIKLGDFTPRIEIDGYVYQRARWGLELPESKKGFERWKTWQSLRLQSGLPERVYIRHPEEPKPFYVDFADPAAIEDIGRLPTGRISITEMLPGPDQLWWQPDGRSQCSEFRLGTLLHYEKPV
jgi:hypothetical protein